MSKFPHAIKYELNKIYVKKKYTVLTIFEVFTILLVVGLVSFFSNKWTNVFTTTIPNVVVNFILPFFAEFVLPLTVFMLASDMISQEFENNSIKNIFLRPINRFGIYLSKNLAIGIYAFFNIIIIFLTTLAARIIFLKDTSGILDLFFSYIMSIIPILVFVGLACFFASRLKSSSMTMFFLIAFYFVLKLASMLYSPLSSVLFFNYSSYYKFFLGSGIPFKHILNTTLLLLSSLSVFFILGYISFERRDV